MLAGAAAITTGFANGAAQIWLDDVQCRGTETRLIDCPASQLGSHNCIHSEDAGVQCGEHARMPITVIILHNYTAYTINVGCI